MGSDRNERLWVGRVAAARATTGASTMTYEQKLAGVARSVNAVEQRLDVLKGRVAQFAAKLARVVR